LQAIEILKDTIENKVRPLSQDFHQRAITLGSTSIFDANVNLKVSRFPRTFVLSKSIMPLSNLLGMVAAIGSVAYMLQGGAAGWSAFAVSIPTLVVFGSAKLLTSKLKPTSAWLNTSVLLLLSLAAAYLDLLALRLLSPNYQHEDLMDVTVFASAVLMAFGTTYYRTLELNRFAIEARMLQLNLELKRELAMFEQQIVATSKRWSYTLHGTVQAALVAAITRLSTADEHSTELVSEVLSDLERIEQVIQKPVNAEIDINQELKELGSSWKNICDIETALSKAAEAKLNTSTTTKFCLIEIAKEAVSNAYRHGSASNVWISIHASEHDSIELIVRNNGKYRAKKSAKKSLGTKMLDEMATEWSIRYLPEEKLTLLRALVPLSKS
jgi:anti-sigma regulatory factor (Ser/Thr protein kinase)